MVDIYTTLQMEMYQNKYTEVQVIVVVDNLLLLKTNFCQDAATSFCRDRINTTCASRDCGKIGYEIQKDEKFRKPYHKEKIKSHSLENTAELQSTDSIVNCSLNKKKCHIKNLNSTSTKRDNMVRKSKSNSKYSQDHTRFAGKISDKKKCCDENTIVVDWLTRKETETSPFTSKLQKKDIDHLDTRKNEKGNRMLHRNIYSNRDYFSSADLIEPYCQDAKLSNTFDNIETIPSASNCAKHDIHNGVNQGQSPVNKTLIEDLLSKMKRLFKNVCLPPQKPVLLNGDVTMVRKKKHSDDIGLSASLEIIENKQAVVEYESYDVPKLKTELSDDFDTCTYTEVKHAVTGIRQAVIKYESCEFNITKVKMEPSDDFDACAKTEVKNFNIFRVKFEPSDQCGQLPVIEVNNNLKTDDVDFSNVIDCNNVRESSETEHKHTKCEYEIEQCKQSLSSKVCNDPENKEDGQVNNSNLVLAHQETRFSTDEESSDHTHPELSEDDRKYTYLESSEDDFVTLDAWYAENDV